MQTHYSSWKPTLSADSSPFSFLSFSFSICCSSSSSPSSFSSPSSSASSSPSSSLLSPSSAGCSYPTAFNIELCLLLLALYFWLACQTDCERGGPGLQGSGGEIGSTHWPKFSHLSLQTVVELNCWESSVS